jgi:hypothetical protein
MLLNRRQAHLKGHQQLVVVLGWGVCLPVGFLHHHQEMGRHLLHCRLPHLKGRQQLVVALGWYWQLPVCLLHQQQEMG